jgi:hypothetical protein
MAYKLASRRAARCACPAPGVPAGLLTRERAANPSGRARGGRSRPRRRSWNYAYRVPEAASGPLGTVASSSVRHGRLRRNAVSPHGVRIGGASGASLWIGCSSANRALAGKLLWDGIVAVPRVFDSGCSVLFSVEERGQPGGSARSGDAGERDSRPGAPRLIPLACGHIATHGGTQGVAGIVDIRRLSEQRESTPAPRGPLYRVDGPSGFTQAAENHGRTISERHNRTPRRRARRV